MKGLLSASVKIADGPWQRVQRLVTEAEMAAIMHGSGNTCLEIGTLLTATLRSTRESYSVDDIVLLGSDARGKINQHLARELFESFTVES